MECLDRIQTITTLSLCMVTYVNGKPTRPGPRLNIKTARWGIGIPIINKTVARGYFLYNGYPYSGDTTSLYWDGSWASINSAVRRLTAKFRSLEAARLDVIMIVSLWHLTGISVAAEVSVKFSERLEKSQPESRSFEASRDFAERLPFALRKEAQGRRFQRSQCHNNSVCGRK